MVTHLAYVAAGTVNGTVATWAVETLDPAQANLC
jgi:hypothetical protein